MLCRTEGQGIQGIYDMIRQYELNDRLCWLAVHLLADHGAQAIARERRFRAVEHIPDAEPGPALNQEDL